MKLRKELNVHYVPNKLTLGSVQKSNMPLLDNKFVQGRSMIYICIDKSCNLPLTTVEEAMKQIN